MYFRQQATLLLLIPALATATMTLNTTIEVDSETYWTAPLLPAAPISASCASAWASNIPCSDWLLKVQGMMMGGSGGDNALDTVPLNEVCTDTCISGLNSWRDNLRSSCNTADRAAVAPALLENGEYTEDWEGSVRARYYMASFLNSSMYMTEFLYYLPCTKDLGTNELCANLPEDDYYHTNDSSSITNATSPTSPEGQAFCNSSCTTQFMTWFHEIAVPTMPYLFNSSDNVVPEDFCPNLDTSKYPFLNSSSSSSSSSHSSSSNTDNSTHSSSSSSSENGSSAGDNTSEGAAAVISPHGTAIWGSAVVLVAVAFGFGGL